MNRPPFRSFLRRFVDRITVLISRVRFKGSRAYWETRYRLQGSSGAGSYGTIARSKANFINEFYRVRQIDDVLELGCGDGAQLELVCYERYTGVDISRTAIATCKKRFAEKENWRFFHLDEIEHVSADLVLSLDVIYHLVEDIEFFSHIDRLFGSARKFVVIFSTNHSDDPAKTTVHVRHRAFTDVCSERFPEFELIQRPARESGIDDFIAGFYVFRKRGNEL